VAYYATINNQDKPAMNAATIQVGNDAASHPARRRLKLAINAASDREKAKKAGSKR
jgi:hypothetical protein